MRDSYRVITDFQKGSQPGTSTLKIKNGDFFTESYTILARWRNHFSQLFNVHGVSVVGRQKYT